MRTILALFASTIIASSLSAQQQNPPAPQPKTAGERIASAHFPFTVESMRLQSKLAKQFGQLAPDTKIYQITNAIKPQTTLEELEKTYGKPDKLETITTADGEEVRWWWEPIFIQSKSTSAAILSHGCRLE